MSASMERIGCDECRVWFDIEEDAVLPEHKRWVEIDGYNTAGEEHCPGSCTPGRRTFNTRSEEVTQNAASQPGLE